MYFDSLLQSYHIPLSNVVAISIILGELILGLCLIFNLALINTSRIGFIITLLFSFVYTYGYFFLDISNCGCFGNFTRLNSSYILFVIRNILILFGFIWICKNYKGCDIFISRFSYFISLLIISIGALLIGNVFRYRTVHPQTNFIPIPLEEHSISKHLNIAKDSTYMISVLSYDCPHCINSIGNLMQYDQCNYVDEVICLFMRNEKAKQMFNSFFTTNFKILELSEEDIYEITDKYPVTFYVKNDSIMSIHTGEIPSAFFYQLKSL